MGGFQITGEIPDRRKIADVTSPIPLRYSDVECTESISGKLCGTGLQFVNFPMFGSLNPNVRTVAFLMNQSDAAYIPPVVFSFLYDIISSEKRTPYTRRSDI